MVFAYFGLFLLSGINDGGTANLSDLASISIEGPAADFISEYVLHEKHSTIKSQPQFIKQLNVLQQVVIGITGEVMRKYFFLEILCTRIKHTTLEVSVLQVKLYIQLHIQGEFIG